MHFIFNLFKYSLDQIKFLLLVLSWLHSTAISFYWYSTFSRAASCFHYDFLRFLSWPIADTFPPIYVTVVCAINFGAKWWAANWMLPFLPSGWNGGRAQDETSMWFHRMMIQIINTNWCKNSSERWQINIYFREIC